MSAEILNALIAGSIGAYTYFVGLAGVIAGYPLDTIKVRLQTQNVTFPQYNGILHCLRCIISQEGPIALYKGMTSPLASIAMVNALCFAAHDQVSKQFTDKHSITTNFFAGAAAGACQAKILREKGVRYLTRGFLSTQVRDCPAMGVYFASFEYIGRQISSTNNIEELNSWQLLLAGGGAGMLSWLANYPSDIIKTRFQADERYSNYSEVIRRIYLEGGLRAFYVGLGSTLVRAFPANAATFFAVEWTYRLWLRRPIVSIDSALQHEERQVLTAAAGLMMIQSEAGRTLFEPILVI
uniref:Mitochondrial carrier protein n=1 Tax=Meloidogyne javanica TaxID=6303 RepID=A0A915MXY6_MELJA